MRLINKIFTDLALDGEGNLYVTGVTQSPDFPVLNPVQSHLGGALDGFVTKINAAGSALVYSSYLGGSGEDVSYGIAVASGSAYITGTTASYDFPAKDQQYPAMGGYSDAYVVKLDPTGTGYLFDTFLTTNGAGDLLAGAAAITSEAHFGAAAIFTVFDAQGRFQTEAGVGEAPVLTDFTIPVDVTGAFDTGIAFFNPGPDSAALVLRLIDKDGKTAATESLTLGSLGHAARFVTQLFSGTSNFRASLAVNSSSGIAALTLRQNGSPLCYTTLPVVRGTVPR